MDTLNKDPTHGHDASRKRSLQEMTLEETITEIRQLRQALEEQEESLQVYKAQLAIATVSSLFFVSTSDINLASP